MDYVMYCLDVETTNLDDRLGDIIEVSIQRLTDSVQNTWWLKPFNPDGIDPGALRVNGHKIEDLLHKTAEGREKYLDPNKVIIDIENFIMEDNVPNTNRIIVGQNCQFDRGFLEQLWSKCNSKDTYPFGKRMLDTQIIEFFLDLCKGEMAEGYSLKNLTKKYGVVNSKAHTAEADVKATTEVLLKQIEFFKKALKKQ